MKAKFAAVAVGLVAVVAGFITLASVYANQNSRDLHYQAGYEYAYSHQGVACRNVAKTESFDDSWLTGCYKAVGERDGR